MFSPDWFGTLNEMMEIITLIQTGKIKKEVKIVVYDEKYWKEFINFDALIKHGTISKKDLKLFNFVNNINEAFNIIIKHFNKYYLNNGVKK